MKYWQGRELFTREMREAATVTGAETITRSEDKWNWTLDGLPIYVGLNLAYRALNYIFETKGVLRIIPVRLKSGLISPFSQPLVECLLGCPWQWPLIVFTVFFQTLAKFTWNGQVELNGLVPWRWSQWWSAARPYTFRHRYITSNRVLYHGSFRVYMMGSIW